MQIQLNPRFFDLISQELGISVEALGKNTILNAIKERMLELEITNEQEYIGQLECSAGEFQMLIEALVISESWFNRDSDGMAAMQHFLMNKTDSEDRIRVLSLPCARGEEPYSLAIQLRNLEGWPARLEIIGGDISREAISHARNGLYNQYSFRGCTKGFMDHNFDPAGNGFYQIKPELRSGVKFVQLNALSSDLVSLGKFDVIFCRNLLIYLNPAAQMRLTRRLARQLTPGGLLIVTAAESSVISAAGSDLQAYFNSCAFVKRDSAGSVKSVSKSVPSIRKVVGTITQSGSAEIESDQAKVTAPREDQFRHSESYAYLESLANQGSYNEALQVCNKLLTEKPTSAQLHFMAGLLNSAIDNLTAAKSFFRQALYLDPDHSEAALALAFDESGGKVSDRARRISERKGGRA